MNTKAFWSRVKSQIRIKGITQTDAAKACGVLPDTFRRWMSTGRVPPLSNSYKLSRYLGLSLEYLINGPGMDKVSETNEEVLKLLKTASEKLKKIRRDNPALKDEH